MARRLRRTRRVEDLTWPQHLELSLGPGARRRDLPPSHFESAAARRAAWFACDPAELFGGDIPGRRLWGWWHYESPEPRDYVMDEAEQLRRMGVLTEAEERQLAVWAATRGQPATFTEDGEDEDEWSDGAWD